MENELQIFENSEFGELEILIEDGKVLFPATESAVKLGYSNPHKAISDHCRGVTKREVGVKTGKKADGSYAVQSVEKNYIPEGDLYRLIIRSKLPSAEKFETWVFDEILPSIRKHGAYATDATIEKILNDPDFGIQLLITLKDEREKRVKAEKTNAILMHVNKTYTATEIAKELGFSSAIALNKFLHDQHIQFKQNQTWVLYSDYADQGYTEIKQEVLDNGKIIYHRRWTQLGRDFLLQKFSPACAV